MKTIKLIKTTNGKSKIVDMPENIWNTILKSPEIIPQGITYELAPTRPVKPIELMKEDKDFEAWKDEKTKEVEDEVEPIEVFTKEETVNESKEINNGVEGNEERKKAPKKQTKKGKR